jgi:hypothetical protein
VAPAPCTFTLGRFTLAGRAVVGLVVADRMLPLMRDHLSAALPDDAPAGDAVPVDVNDLLRAWDAVQAGANCRTHVIDLAFQHAEIREGMTEQGPAKEVSS